MGRIKQNQTVDNLVRAIKFVIENQCSQSVEDQLILNEALMNLQRLKFKKGKTNKEIQRTALNVIELISKFLMNDIER